jgi:uncharacterized protein YpiB (UPF0302 family)
VGEKKKLRTKDLQEEFEEIKSNDELDISLTISKSSSSAASQVIDVVNKSQEEDEPKKEKETDEKKDIGKEEGA